jgi:hypothetical protein
LRSGVPRCRLRGPPKLGYKTQGKLGTIAAQLTPQNEKRIPMLPAVSCD